MGTSNLVDKVEAMAALACLKRLSPAALKVAIRLFHHYNCGTGRCDPSIGTLAKSTQLTERSVQRAISELEEMGLFTIRHHRGRHRTNSYHPNFSQVFRTVEREKVVNEAAGEGDAENLTGTSKKPDNLSRQNLTAMSGKHMKEHLNEPIPSKDSLEPDRSRKAVPGNAWQGGKIGQIRDPMKIDWVSWSDWLQIIGKPNGTLWINDAIDLVRSETELDFGRASLLVDSCLRKARALWPDVDPLEKLLVQAITRERNRG